MSLTHSKNYFFWVKTLRKYKKTKETLSTTTDKKSIFSLTQKLETLEKRILRLRKKYALKLGLGLLMAWFANPTLAQTKIDVDNDDRIEIIDESPYMFSDKYDLTGFIGDLNNDGFNDIGITNIRATGYHVVFGDGHTQPEDIDLNQIEAGDGIHLTSSDSYWFGHVVAPVEDINGDGINDLAIFDEAKVNYGQHPSYILFGSEEGFPDSIDLATMSDGDGLEFLANGNYWGNDLESGDVNGDGVSDLVLAYQDGERVEVFLGSPTGFESKSIDWDASLNGVDGFSITDDSNDLGFSTANVSVPGDINGDGYDDIILNAGLDWLSERSQDAISDIYVVYGQANFPADIKHSEINGMNGFRIKFNTGAMKMGTAGDINGDGLADFMVSPYPEYLSSISDSNSFIIYGRCGNSFPHNTNIYRFLQLTNGELIENSILYPSDVKVDINQDGFHDMIFQDGGYDSRMQFYGDYKVLLSDKQENPANCITTKIHGKISLESDNSIGLPLAEINIPTLGTFYTGSLGEYEIVIPGSGEYALTFSHPNDNVTIVSEALDVSVASDGDEVEQNNQYQYNQNYHDVGLTITSGNIARPGFEYKLAVAVQNLGTHSSNTSEVMLTLPSEFTLTEIPDGATQVGNILTWNVVDLANYYKSTVRIEGEIDPTTPLGTEISFDATITASSAIDIRLENNEAVLTSEVRGSYDPNDKTTLSEVSPEFIQNGEYLDYLIRFQNTGTDTAFTVVVTDTLSNDLQWDSFEMIASSHEIKVSRLDSILNFRFDNILLVDSATNELDSHGYIRFKIKPAAYLVEGDYVDGRANIYFDFNSPVITNNMITDIRRLDVTSLGETFEDTHISIYPNPTSEYIIIEGVDALNWELINTQGVLLENGTGKKVDLETYPAGVYIVRVNGVGYKVIKS